MEVAPLYKLLLEWADELLSKMWEWVMDGYPQDCHDF